MAQEVDFETTASLKACVNMMNEMQIIEEKFCVATILPPYSTTPIGVAHVRVPYCATASHIAFPSYIQTQKTVLELAFCCFIEGVMTCIGMGIISNKKNQGQLPPCLQLHLIYSFLETNSLLLAQQQPLTGQELSVPWKVAQCVVNCILEFLQLHCRHWFQLYLCQPTWLPLHQPTWLLLRQST